MDKKALDKMMWFHFKQRQIAYNISNDPEQSNLLFEVQFRQANMERKEYTEYFNKLFIDTNKPEPINKEEWLQGRGLARSNR
jgi:hypothetical protein